MIKKTLIIFSIALMFCACQKDFSVWREKNEEWLKENATHLPDSIESGVTASGLQYEIFHRGFGEQTQATSEIIVKYTGWLIDGNKFATSTAADWVVGGQKQGLQEMLCKMNLHNKARFKIYVPYDLAYGKDGMKSGNKFYIPPYSTLIYDVEILEVYQHSPSEYD